MSGIFHLICCRPLESLMGASLLVATILIGVLLIREPSQPRLLDAASPVEWISLQSTPASNFDDARKGLQDPLAHEQLRQSQFSPTNDMGPGKVVANLKSTENVELDLASEPGVDIEPVVSSGEESQSLAEVEDHLSPLTSLKESTMSGQEDEVRSGVRINGKIVAFELNQEKADQISIVEIEGPNLEVVEHPDANTTTNQPSSGASFTEAEILPHPPGNHQFRPEFEITVSHPQASSPEIGQFDPFSKSNERPSDKNDPVANRGQKPRLSAARDYVKSSRKRPMVETNIANNSNRREIPKARNRAADNRLRYSSLFGPPTRKKGLRFPF